MRFAISRLFVESLSGSFQRHLGIQILGSKGADSAPVPKRIWIWVAGKRASDGAATRPRLKEYPFGPARSDCRRR
jgi:hypothetical protein